MKAVLSFEELSTKIKEAEEAQSISDDAFRKSLTGWYFSPPLIDDCPADPFSAAYKAFQLDFYERLTNQGYAVTNEETDFNFEQEIKWPYPYGTRSADTVGTHLLGYGWLIKKMALPPESRILEIGSGYGALTYHLARMGYQVSCLDISQSLLNFVQARTASAPQEIEIICGDMATVDIPGTYDAVIFNASLHHSLEHRAVVQRLASILAPAGIIAFTSEPVVPQDSILVPYPWGIRLGGLGIWSIIQWGWMELGFQEPYFLRLLQAAGYHATRYNLGISGQTDVWIASRSERRETSTGSGSSLMYDVDLETEVIRLRRLVEGYENGRVMRLMNWLKKRMP
jgi:SAM-dependent methyltransferase